MPESCQLGPREGHTLPGVHALHLAELAKRWNVTPEALLEGSGLDVDALADPDARVPVPTLVELVERARRMTGEPALGIYLGLQMRISAHGYLGFAAMTAATARHALELASRFAPTRTTALSLRLHVEAGVASVVIEEHADFGPARDVVLFALAIGIWQIGIALTGQPLRGSADFAFPEPSYFERFAKIAPRTRFAQPSNQLVFDENVLDLPLTMADPAALRLAADQLTRALDLLGAGGHIVTRVRALVSKKEGGVRSLDETAAQLHLSARTLKRRLAAEGAAYSELVEEEQREKALLLLRSAELSIDEIAWRVGYSDVANFSRAFRRWTGTTPAAYRRASVAGGRRE